MQKQLTFKKDITRKFIIFAIIPSFLLALSLLYTLVTLKEDSIFDIHQKLLKTINYHISDLHKDILLTEELIKTSQKNDKYLYKNLLHLNQFISSVVILDNKGKIKKVYTSNDNINNNINVNNFKVNTILDIEKFLETKKSYFGNIYQIADENEYFIPYFFEHKGLIYIINIKSNYFQHYIQELLSDDLSLGICIVDSNGLCIAHSFQSPSQKEHFSFYTTATSKAVLLNSPNQLIKFTDKNQTYRVTYSDQKETNWKIIVKDSNDKVLGYIQNILLFIGSFMVLLLIFTIMTAKRVAKNIVEPVESLILEIQDFANEVEHFETTSTIKSKYYIFNVLIESFEKMKDDIIDREIELKNLNDSLEEKTIQLETLNQTLQYRLRSQG